MYLACHEDTRRVTKQYIDEVIKAREERDATHAMETEARKEAIKVDNHEDLVIRLLDVMHKAAPAQAKRAVNDTDTRYRKLSRSMCPSVPRGL